MVHLLKRAFAVALISFSTAFAVPTTWNIHPTDSSIIQIKDENMSVIDIQMLKGSDSGFKMITTGGITYNLPNLDQLYPANIAPSARKSNAIKIETIDLTSSGDGESISESETSPTASLLEKRPRPADLIEEIQQPHSAPPYSRIVPGPATMPFSFYSNLPSAAPRPAPVPDAAPSLREEDLPNWNERARTFAPTGDHLNAIVCWAIDPYNRGMLLFLDKNARVLHTKTIIDQKGRRSLDSEFLRISLNGKYRKLGRHPDDHKNLYDNGFKEGFTAKKYTKKSHL